jgi:hypothetical protein
MADDDQQEQYDYNNMDNVDLNLSYACTSWSPVVGFAGVAAAVVFASKSFSTNERET